MPNIDKLCEELIVGPNTHSITQRFKDYCKSKCINRRLVLHGFNLGPCAAREIANILSVNRNIVHIDLSKNNLQDEGVK